MTGSSPFASDLETTRRHLRGEMECRQKMLATLGEQGNRIAELEGLLREARPLIERLRAQMEHDAAFGFAGAAELRDKAAALLEKIARNVT